MKKSIQNWKTPYRKSTNPEIKSEYFCYGATGQTNPIIKVLKLPRDIFSFPLTGIHYFYSEERPRSHLGVPLMEGIELLLELSLSLLKSAYWMKKHYITVNTRHKRGAVILINTIKCSSITCTFVTTSSIISGASVDCIIISLPQEGHHISTSNWSYPKQQVYFPNAQQWYQNLINHLILF